MQQLFMQFKSICKIPADHLLGQNSRAVGLFETDVLTESDGRARLVWQKVEAWRNWAALSEGCYLLRTNKYPRDGFSK